jgi:hypothetical protein
MTRRLYALFVPIALACSSGAGGRQMESSRNDGAPDAAAPADAKAAADLPAGGEDAPAAPAPDVAPPPVDAAPIPVDVAPIPVDTGDRVGVVELLLHDRYMTSEYRLTATFGPAARGCEEREREDGCVVTYCPPVGPLPAVAPSAGRITVSGAKIPLAAAPGPSGTYGTSARGPVSDGGETVTISAGGAEVPAFEVQLTVPATTDIFHPNYDPNAINLFGRDEGLELRAAYTGGRLEGFLADALSPPYNAVTCFPAPDFGLIFFPPKSIAALHGTDEGHLRVRSISRKEVMAGGWRITVTVAQAMMKTGWWTDYDYKMRIPCAGTHQCWPGFTCTDFFACQR